MVVPRPQYTGGEPCAAERRTEGTTSLASCRWRRCSRRWVSGGVVEWRFEVPEPKKVENVGRRCLLAVANECKASTGLFNPIGDGPEAPHSTFSTFWGSGTSNLHSTTPPETHHRPSQPARVGPSFCLRSVGGGWGSKAPFPACQGAHSRGRAGKIRPCRGPFKCPQSLW